MLKELLEKRDKLIADARAALDEIRKNTDEARAAELDKRHDDLMVEVDAIDVKIAREERMAKIEKDAEQRAKEARDSHRPGANGDADLGGGSVTEEDGTVTYRSAFYKFLAVGGDASDLSQEERSALRGGVASKQDLKELRAQSAGVAIAGGYTVPTELAAFIVRSMKAWGPMYDGTIVTDITTTSGHNITIPTVDDTANEAAARAENAAIVDDGSGDVVFGQKLLEAYVHATPFIRFSMELANDSAFGVEALLGDLIGERLGRIANRRNTTGTGAGQPNGIVTASSLGKTSAAAAAITFDELLDLEHSIDPAYRVSPKCRYMFNDGTLLALRKLKDSEGRYIWQAGNVQQGVPASLNGRPYSINQHMDGLAAAKKPVIFGDLGKYFVRKVGSPLVGVMRERFWPDLGIAGLIRFDGELSDTAAVKHLLTAA
ncbi:MAG TPA: phage major capsid protein [Allosphingosinicella sp.]|jgi:HK97 family phage major capsid protein